MFEIIKGNHRHATQMHDIEAESFAVPWSVMSIEYELMQKHTICYVATENDTVIGHIYMRHIISEGHIVNLAVKKSQRKKGIAYALIFALSIAAQEMDMRGLTLEVRESNTAAIALYEKHGFVSGGVRKNYYTNPTENGIIMWKYFKNGR
ncbi:MAG: ribosomal protein S18-alanine N-acetyltransferase [Defluviitaleaceae bacterium]|nr:ribosomal protein S18-alanine N-acetyltransferase [Defluviitaleaceae bacterium]